MAKALLRNNGGAGLFRCKRFLGLLPQFLQIAATPKLTAHSQQLPKCRAVCRPCVQAPLATLCPALPPAESQPQSGARGWVPLPRGEATHGLRQPGSPTFRPGTDSSGPPGSPSPLPPAAGLHQPEPRSPPPRRDAKSAPYSASGHSARLPGPRHQPPSAPLYRGPHLGEEPRAAGAVGSQSFCKWHLELAASQRIFT